MANIHTPTKHVISKESITPTAFTTSSATTHGSWIDCRGARVCMIDVAANISAGTSATFTVDDTADQITINSDVFSGGSEFAVVVPSAATGSQLDSPGHQVMSVNLAKRQRYLRVTEVNAGGVTGAVRATFLLFNENTVVDPTFGNADSQDNTDLVNS